VARKQGDSIQVRFLLATTKLVHFVDLAYDLEVPSKITLLLIEAS
jgi:hypothetical protein